MEKIEELVTALAYKWWNCGVPDDYENEWKKESECTQQECINFARQVHQLYQQEASDDVKADPYDLWVVVMPLVRIMKGMHMSWAQRTEVAWAIQESLRKHKQLIEKHSRVSSENSCTTKGQLSRG